MTLIFQYLDQQALIPVCQITDEYLRARFNIGVQYTISKVLSPDNQSLSLPIAPSLLVQSGTSPFLVIVKQTKKIAVRITERCTEGSQHNTNIATILSSIPIDCVIDVKTEYHVRPDNHMYCMSTVKYWQ